MTKKLACPVCGGLNARRAQRCETCGAVFETLPEELRPIVNENESVPTPNPAAPESGEYAPDWLRNLIPSIDSDSENDENDDYGLPEEANGSTDTPDLLGELFPEIRESLDSPDSASAEDEPDAAPFDPFGSAVEKAAADDEERERENEFAGFENHRPQPKWETDPIGADERGAEAESEDDDTGEAPHELNQDEARAESDAVDRRKSAEADGGSEEETNEDSYHDFERFRPQRKWDDERQDAAAAESEPAVLNDETAEVEPENGGEDQDENQDAIAAADPVLPDRLALDAKSEEAPESEYSDFERHRPQRKWDDDGQADENGTALPAEKSAENETASRRTESDSGERDGDRQDAVGHQREYVDFSVHRPQDKVADAEAPEAKAAEESETENGADAPFFPAEESSLVSEFLAGLTGGNADRRTEAETGPALPDETPRPENTVGAENFGGVPESGTSAAYDEISEIWNPVGATEDGAEETAASAAETIRRDAEADRKTLRSAPDENEDGDSDALIPAEAKTDGLDEIPWNLFDSGEMNFPSVPNARRDPLTPAARTSSDAADYQQRMVAGILSKVFRAERQSRGFANPRARVKNRAAIILFALGAIFGVLTILGANLRIRIAELPIRSENAAPEAAAAFAERIASAAETDRFELIFDYSFAYETALNRTASDVIEKLRGKRAEISVLAANDAAYALVRELYPEREGANALPIAYVPGVLGALTLDDGRKSADAAILFCADAVRVQRWIETYRLIRPERPLYLVSVDQTAAILRPFTRTEAVAGALLTLDESAYFRGEAALDPTRLTALWFLIGTALAAIFLGTAAREPLTPVIAPAQNDAASTSDAGLTEANGEDDEKKSDHEGERDA